jgi:hypothetical protein
MDPELGDFDVDTFRAHLKYGNTVYRFDQAAYYDGIETFPAQPSSRYAVDHAGLFDREVSKSRCCHFKDDKANWFASDDADVQLRQLRRQCPCRTNVITRSPDIMIAALPTKRPSCHSFDTCRRHLLRTLPQLIETCSSTDKTNYADLIAAAQHFKLQLQTFGGMKPQ